MSTTERLQFWRNLRAFRRNLPQAVVGVHLLVAGLFAASSLYAASVASWTTIVKDQWRIYEDYLFLEFPLNVLVGQNGHHPVVTGLLALADIRWFGAHNYLLNAVGLILAVVAASAWSWMIVGNEELPWPVRWMCTGAVWILLFWLANGRVLVHGNESTHVFPVLCGLFLAIWALLRSRAERVGDGGRTGLGLALVAASGCLLATFSFGLGILTWAIALGVAMIMGIPRGTKIVLVVGAAGAALAYLALPSQGRAAGDALGALPGEVVVDAVTWLGSPVFHALRPFGALSDDSLIGLLAPSLGAIGLVLSAATFVVAVRRRGRSSDLELWSLALLGLGVGGAMLIAMARSSYFDVFPQQRVAPRYLPWVCAFWAAALTSLALHLHRLKRGRRLAIGVWASVVFLLPVGVVHSHSARVFEFAKYRQRDAGLAVALGIENDEVIRVLFSRPAVIRRVSSRLRPAELGIFSGPRADHVGVPIVNLCHITMERDIKGFVTRRQQLADGRGTAYRLTGRIEGSLAGYPLVAFVDEAGVIGGWGYINASDHTIARRIGVLLDGPPRFSGYVTRRGDEDDMTIYAVSLERRVATPIGAVSLSRLTAA